MAPGNSSSHRTVIELSSDESGEEHESAESDTEMGSATQVQQIQQKHTASLGRLSDPFQTPCRSRPSSQVMPSTLATASEPSLHLMPFDESAVATTVTPGTPIDDQDGLADSPLAHKSVASRKRVPARKAVVGKRRKSAPANGNIGETGHPAPRIRPSSARFRPSTADSEDEKSTLDVTGSPSPGLHPRPRARSTKANGVPTFQADASSSSPPGAFPCENDSQISETDIPRRPEIPAAISEPQLRRSTMLLRPRARSECLNQTCQRPVFERYGHEKNPARIRSINGKIYECIKKTRKPEVDKEGNLVCKPGWIYIFESPEHAPNHVKIGKTKHEPAKRLRTWRQCNMDCLEEVDDADGNSFGHYSIVEGLIEAELHNFRRKFKCNAGCNKVHIEWYEIHRAKASVHVSRWRRWIVEQKPFDKEGKLTPYWKWRVEKLKKELDNVDWDSWTQPSPLDYLAYQLEQSGNPAFLCLLRHFSRKDWQFCLTGTIVLLLLYIVNGKSGVGFGALALIAL